MYYVASRKKEMYDDEAELLRGTCKLYDQNVN